MRRHGKIGKSTFTRLGLPGTIPPQFRPVPRGEGGLAGRLLSGPDAAGYGRSKTQQGVLDVRMTLFGAALAAVAIAAASPQPAAAQGQGTSVVVIDISYIFKNHVRFKEAQDAMKKEVEQFEETIRRARRHR